MAPDARLLDLTRLVSRLGKGPATGIDRVESAYLEHLLGPGTPVFGLIRSAVGYMLLDRAGMWALRDGNIAVGKNDIIGRLAYRRDPARGRAEAALRRVAIARCTRPLLWRMLRQYLPQNAGYLSVGHANLDHACLAQVHRAGLRIGVLVHDTIPLDHPDFARQDSVLPFRHKMQSVSRHADVVIHTTQDTRRKTERWLGDFGRVPPGIIAPLGVLVSPPVPADVPTVLCFAGPYFVALGTIEPRKNYSLLLDAWQLLANIEPTPQLVIIGARGWANMALLARLEALPAGGPVTVLHGLSDGAVAALIDGSQALLFPSLAEGFGLPPIEAAARGVPVISANLAVVRDLIGDFAVYLDPTDAYSWAETIAKHKKPAKPEERRMTPPVWADHFKIVLSRM